MKTIVSKFKVVESDPDGSGLTTERVLIGRLTPARLQAILAVVEALDNPAPYGVSANGYPFRCGHQWDCCGCLINARASVTIEVANGFKVEEGAEAIHAISVRVQRRFNC